LHDFIWGLMAQFHHIWNNYYQMKCCRPDFS